MKILAIEFSSKLRSVAAGDTANAAPAPPLAFASEWEEGGAKPFRLIAACLEELSWAPGEVEGIVFSLGPGGFTGIRTAIAIAQGWQLGRNVKCAGVSAMDALARQCGQTGFSGGALLAIPAQRREFHVVEYVFENGSPRLARPLALLPHEEVERRGRNGLKLLGPGLKEHIDDAKDLYPCARELWACACQWDDFPNETPWEPIHLRSADFVKAPPTRTW